MLSLEVPFIVSFPMARMDRLYKILQVLGLAFGLALVIPSNLNGQGVEEVLEQAKAFSDRDQLDSAQVYYQKAYNEGQFLFRSLAGLMNTALSRANLSAADSLRRMGEELLADEGDSDLLGLCQFWTSKGNFYTQNSQLEKAIEAQRQVIQLSKGLSERPQVYAYALFHTALTFEKLTNYDSSLYYAERAYPLLQESVDSTTIAFASIYNGLAVCYQRANRLPQAKSFYLKSIALSEKELGPVSSDLARSLNNLSSIYRAEGNYSEAIRCSERSLQINRILENGPGISSAYYALGIYHYFIGDYGRCKDYLEACIAIRKELYAPMHYSLIGPFEVLGIAHEEGGNYRETLRYLKEGLKRIQANYPPASLLEGYNYENTALTYKSLEQLDSALYYIQQSNKILPQSLPEQDYGLATHYFSYADILYHLGEVSQSRQYLQQSNAIYESLQLQSTSEYALNLAMGGLLLMQEERWDEAGQSFESALASIRLDGIDELDQSAFPWSPNTLLLLNHYTDYLYQRYQVTGDEKVLEQFENYAQLYLDVSEKFRKQFTDPYTKSILIKDNAKVYQRNIGIYQQLYLATADPKYLATVYQFSEHGRTCLLRDIQDNKIQRYQGVPNAIIERESELKDQVAALSEQVLEYPDSQQLRQALFSNEQSLDEYLDTLQEQYPNYYRLKFNKQIPALAEVQAQLYSKQSILEYMQDDTAYYALVVTTKESLLLHLGRSSMIDEKVNEWKKAITNRDQYATEELSDALYQILWAPLQGDFSGNQVNLIPSGKLFYLNFEALKPKGEDQQYLIFDYHISYALSINVLFKDSAPARKGPIVFVAPGFEPEIKQNYQEQLDSLSALDEDYMKTIRQPWSLKLAKQLKKKSGFQIYEGIEAKESNVVQELPAANVLYFSTHAIANAADPLRSKLILAKELGEQIEDGYLHAYELFGLQLDADLAILSACESGIGNLQEGEGMISLAYSLQFAGCQSTALSLWKVDEKINTQITAAFMDNLQKGHRKSEALRLAKLSFLKDQPAELLHPFYWGGMIHMGQDGVIHPSRGFKFWWLWVSAAVGLLFLLVFRGKALNLR